MTEEEARTKWCPFVQLSRLARRTIGSNRGIQTDTQGGEVHLTCIASNCMAWRWGNSIGEIPERGYCGLAGKP